jgi:hypothetical protein
MEVRTTETLLNSLEAKCADLNTRVETLEAARVAAAKEAKTKKSK